MLFVVILIFVACCKREAANFPVSGTGATGLCPVGSHDRK